MAEPRRLESGPENNEVTSVRLVPPLLRPLAPTAADALLCGDPARALAIAQHLMELPRMSNHNRGLWGYHGVTRAGSELTVQGTGIGGPSAVAVLGELVALGTRRIVRIGTCTGAPGRFRLGELLVVSAARSGDGTSRALGAGPEVEPDPALTEALIAANGGRAAVVTSSDLRSSPPPDDGLADLQTAAVFAGARRFGARAASVLLVTRVGDRPLADQPTEDLVLAAADFVTSVLDGLPQAQLEP